MSQQTVNVLLVEDDDVDAMAVERGFRALRIANPVVRARDGLEALALLRGTPGAPPIPQPRLVLLDLNLPGMGGVEFLAHLRGDPALRSTIVFVLTTSRADEDRLAAYDLNAAGYLVKSNFPDAFLECLRMLDHYWRVVEFP